MGAQLARNAEPIPGYRLIETLGAGGFGEVWKAEAPGGILKAIKFVYGAIEAGEDDRGCADQELKALNRVKSVRHPYILSLERFDIINGQLVIVMELAERSLWERYQECRKLGLPGIPREELLRFMVETAEALDLMNLEHNLQHLDIKPQNLFLVHNHIKVGDFGLVKDLEGIRAQVSSGVTPVYAAPETFEGVVSRYCDQYNLAIVYQELLTGQRPFNGNNSRQLMLQHIQGKPNLESLCPSDRTVIQRALSKNPEDRFPTCGDMVKLLWSNRVDGENAPEPGTISIPISSSITLSAPFQASPSTTKLDPYKKPLPPVTRPETKGDGVLMPTLVIGVGCLGLRVLRHLRTSLIEQYGSAERLPTFRFFGIDSDPTALKDAGASDGLVPESFVGSKDVILTPLQRPTHYLKPSIRPTIETWMDSSVLRRVPRNEAATHGLRPLGRLALVDNFKTIFDRIRAELLACADATRLTWTADSSGLGLRTNQPRVYIVAGLAGGTGSGMFLDLAYLVRHQIQQLGFARVDVCGLLLLPQPAPVDPDLDADDGHDTPVFHADPALGNTVAALTELQHFSSPKTAFSAFYEEGREVIVDPEKPFNHCVVVPYQDRTTGADPESFQHQAAARAADFLTRTLLTTLGRTAETVSCNAPENFTPGVLCRAIAASSVVLPRRPLVRAFSNTVTDRVLQGWVGGKGMEAGDVTHWLEERIAAHKLGDSDMQLRFQQECEKALEILPDAAFKSTLGPVVAGGVDTLLKTTLVREAVRRLDEVLGQPAQEVDRNASRAARDAAKATGLEIGLEKASRALSVEFDRHLRELAFGLLDEPGGRLLAAETATQTLLNMLQHLAGEHLERADTAAAETKVIRVKLEAALQSVERCKIWLFRNKPKIAAEIRELLEAYPRLEYQERMRRRLHAVYEHATELLGQRCREIDFCRGRLNELKRTAGRAESFLEPAPAASRRVYPRGAETLEEAVQALNREIGHDQLHKLEVAVQAMIRKRFTSLYHLCMSPSDRFGELLSALQAEVVEFVQTRLGTESIAERYLAHFATSDQAAADVRRLVVESEPALAAGRRDRGCNKFIVALPDDRAGDRVLDMVEAAVAGASYLDTGRKDDLVIYQECPDLPLSDLPQLDAGREAYRQLDAVGPCMVHTRNDVGPWQSLFPNTNR